MFSDVGQHLDRVNGCMAYTEHYETRYGYLPIFGAGAAFIALFGISTIGHLFQAGWRRRVSSFIFAFAALVECLGWSARTWSSKCPYNRPLFLAQLTTLTLAPSILLIGLFSVLRTLMQRLGRDSSFFSANICLYVLLTSEVVSLIVRSIGVALISRAIDINHSTLVGMDILLAGSALQLLTIAIFILFLLDLFRRVYRHSLGLTHAEIYVITSLSISIVALLVRGIYRTVSYSLAQNHHFATNQYFFIGFDGIMMVMALGILNILDPVVLLKDGFERIHVKIYVDDTDSDTTSEVVYNVKGNRFEMVNSGYHANV